MFSYRVGPPHRSSAAATLLTIGAYVALTLIVVWGIVGFIAAP